MTVMTTKPSRLPVQIAPSILAADFSKLGAEVNAVVHAGADLIHFDVMDHHYVPNLSVGPMVLEHLCASTKAASLDVEFDVHLMCDPVDELVREFAEAGANWISIHPDATRHIHRSLSLIRDVGCKAGLALNPGTAPTVVEPVLDRVDQVLVMSVNPGFGGQSFIESSLDKIETVRKVVGDSIHVEVDGGIKVDNISAVSAAGANRFVAGSAVFGAASYDEVIADLRNAAVGSQ